MGPSIYRYSAMVPYLQASGLHDADSPGNSLAALALRLGYRSRRSVAMVFNGDRLPSAQMTQRLSRLLGHSERESWYFGLLVEKARLARRGVSTDHIDKELRTLRPLVGTHPTLTDAGFAKISSWYFLPLKQLVESPGFRDDPQWVSRRLRRKVTAAQVESALAVMERLGMIGRDPEGRRVVRASMVVTGQDVPNAAIQAHHRQMLRRAAEALDEQGVEEREISGLTLAIASERLPEARAYLREFCAGFAARFHDDLRSDIYQLNLQLFAHTARAPGKAGGTAGHK